MNIGTTVQQFYNTQPFPDYDLQRFTTKEDLRIVASPFANVLSRSIPHNASILDVGTGTGQLSAYLSLTHKSVMGIDFSDTALAKACKLKAYLHLRNWRLRKVDLMDQKQLTALGTFDYVLCLGVLHHTNDAQKGFNNICHLLKPRGRIAIGLYHALGRIPLKLRKRVYTKYNEKILNLQLPNTTDAMTRKGFWHDQYQHPHETTHTVHEVKTWFRNQKIHTIQTLPSTTIHDPSILDIAGVWNTGGDLLARQTLPGKEVSFLWKTQREGGYFMIFGEKQ